MYCIHTHMYFIVYSIEVTMIRTMITKSYILGMCTFKKKKKKKRKKEKEKKILHFQSLIFIDFIIIINTAFYVLYTYTHIFYCVFH